MSKISDLKQEDLVDLYDLVYSQSQEDRKIILDLYNDLYALVRGDAQQYAISGETLGKFADILVKQTSQAIEFVKIMQKQKEKDDTLTAEDLEKVGNALKNQ